MNMKFLFIENRMNGNVPSHWYTALCQALSPYGDTEVVEFTPTHKDWIEKQFSMVVVDATVDMIDRLIPEIRQLSPNTLVVIAAVAPSWRDARAFFKAGAHDYIRKSTIVTELREQFRQILDIIGNNESHTTQTISHSTMHGCKNQTILFADNDELFLNTRKEFLENAGYQVLPCYTVVETFLTLTKYHCDLVILDMRLTNDNDENDQTGLDVARTTAHSIPKIILTGYENYEATREALKSSIQTRSIAIDVLAKDDGPKALLQAVEEILG